MASYFKNSTKNDFYYYFFSIFLEEKLKSMAFLYDQTVEELTASTRTKVAIGVLLTLIFHLGDVLLGGRLAKNYKINVSEIGKVNHLQHRKRIYYYYFFLDSLKGIPATSSCWYTFINSLVGEIDFPLCLTQTHRETFHR